MLSSMMRKFSCRNKDTGKNKVWRKILFCVLSIPVMSAGLAYLTVSILDGYYKWQAERELNMCFEGRDSLVAKLDYDKDYDYRLTNCIHHGIYGFVTDSIYSNAAEKDAEILRKALDGVLFIGGHPYCEPAYYYYMRVTKDSISVLKDCPYKIGISKDYISEDYLRAKDPEWDLAEIMLTEIDPCYQLQFLDSVTIALLDAHPWSYLLSDISISNRYYWLTDCALVDDDILYNNAIQDEKLLFSKRYGFFAWYPLRDYGKIYYNRDYRASLKIDRRPGIKKTQYNDFLWAFFISLIVLVLLSCFFWKN